MFIVSLHIREFPRFCNQRKKSGTQHEFSRIRGDLLITLRFTNQNKFATVDWRDLQRKFTKLSDSLAHFFFAFSRDTEIR